MYTHLDKKNNTEHLNSDIIPLKCLFIVTLLKEMPFNAE